MKNQSKEFLEVYASIKNEVLIAENMTGILKLGCCLSGYQIDKNDIYFNNFSAIKTIIPRGLSGLQRVTEKEKTLVKKNVE